MTTDLRRIRAVAASLRGIRERVDNNTDVSYWNTAPFDRAMGLLEDAVDGANFCDHAIDDTQLDRTDYLVHLDSVIAFLEVYEKDGEGSAAILAFPPRQQG